MNRALRAATMGVLLLSPVALTACSAGQVPQTATQNRDKVGPEAAVGDITLRQITLAYPQDGLYEEGGSAELQMAIVNGDTEADTLVGIEGEAFDGVVVSGQATASAVPSSPSAAPVTTSPATPTTPGTLPTPTPGSTPTPGTLPTPSVPAAPSASTQVQLPIPAGSTVFLGGASGATVELAGLSEELTVGENIEVTLTFERAGEVTVPVVVATPERVLPRGEPFDFHQEEGHGEAPAEGAEDIAREGESEAGSGPGEHD
ncbi:copper chaperone PCu(A)C [Geodermatophilus chilensis]|uniref:copper chaperone PCu(A)C n=1 Tax=Geodermatophilus chilensis TaxID=2035835 RepID=UPI0013000042|nr:copper chaperone PCu(A)C [Geodermatophilus chilensis]